MRRNFMTMAGMVIWLLVIFNFSWAACPQDPNDLGNCDTLHVVPFPTTDTCIIYAYHFTDEPESDYTDTICINNPGEEFPCFLYVNLLVTHDSNTFWWEGSSKWVQDSIAAFVVPLGWTRTNPAKYCSLSTYWNENTVDADANPPGVYPRRIWRNFPPLGSDSINLMGKLKWPTMLVFMSSDSELYSGVMTPPHAFIGLFASTKKKWSQQKDTLLATLTFRVEDTMTICIDSTLFPPSDHLSFIRYDAQGYVPRSNLPLCIWVGPPQIEVLSPNGGDTLCVGSTKDITWLSKKFTDPVKIEYSTDGGQSWIEIEASTPNDGVHPWPVPNTPSINCLVKVSDAADGEPKDSSDAPFTILAPDFSIDASPDTLRVPRGYSGNYKVILTSINGFASNCTLTVTEDYPPGATATFEHPVLVPTDSSLLTLTIPSDAALDTFTLTIIATEMGKGEGIADSEYVTLIVTLPTWIFEVDAFPDEQTISQGGSTNYDVTIIPTQGFTAPCTLFVEFVGGLPSGVTADFDSNPIPPNDTSTLTITTLLSTPPDTYDLAIIAVPNKKQKDTTYVKLIIEQTTDVDEEGDQPNAPDKFALFQNQPNPFNPETKISYYLPEGCEIKLTVYNILGRRVKTLFEGYQNAGMKTLVWDGKDDQGKQLSSGIYFYRLQAGDFIQTRKMSLIK